MYAKKRTAIRSGVVALLGALGAAAAFAADPNTPPDLTVCESATCESLPDNVCSDAGFKITLTNYVAASGANSGTASYTYELCSPALGVCEGGLGLRAGESCSDNSFCQSKGQDDDPEATCNRECATDEFRGLSHFDVTFPELGAVEGCVSAETEVTGSCTNGNFVLGDASCNLNDSKSAKCDNTELDPGECLEMTVNIAGETNTLGLGAAVVVDKESTTCTASCIAGPSCEDCGGNEEGDQCLTRTLGFWGTHPWITNNYVPVSVCGEALGCNAPSDGKSDPACEALTCESVMEGLGSNPGNEGIKNSGGTAYVSMIKQLTAAKLNLNATAAVTEDSSCADWEYDGLGIDDWIGVCEGLCGASQSAISESGCIEALNAFNNSEDVLDVTPAPFDRPPVDDFGNVSGADSRSFTKAAGNAKKEKLVIGKGQCAI
jgi:hypothetical protein